MSFIDILIDTFISALIALMFITIVGSIIAIPILAIMYHSAWYLLLFIVWLTFMAFGRWVMENY